jgi:hypothetical protein
VFDLVVAIRDIGEAIFLGDDITAMMDLQCGGVWKGPCDLQINDSHW